MGGSFAGIGTAGEVRWRRGDDDDQMQYRFAARLVGSDGVAGVDWRLAHAHEPVQRIGAFTETECRRLNRYYKLLSQYVAIK